VKRRRRENGKTGKRENEKMRRGEEEKKLVMGLSQ